MVAHSKPISIDYVTYLYAIKNGEQSIVLAYRNQREESDRRIADLKKIIEKSPNSFVELDERERAIEEVALCALRIGSMPHLLFNAVPEETRYSDSFIMKALAIKGTLFKDIPESLKHKEELTLIAVENDARAIAFLKKEQKDHPRIVEIALESNSTPIKYLDVKFRNDPTIMMNLVKSEKGFRGNVLKYATAEIKMIKEIVLAAAKNFLDFDLVPAQFANDDEIVFECFKNWGIPLKNIGHPFIQNRSNLIKVLKYNLEHLDCHNSIPEQFYKDPEIILMIVEKQPWFLADIIHYHHSKEGLRGIFYIIRDCLINYHRASLPRHKLRLSDISDVPRGSSRDKITCWEACNYPEFTLYSAKTSDKKFATHPYALKFFWILACLKGERIALSIFSQTGERPTSRQRRS